MWQCGSKIATYLLLHITKIPSHIRCVQEWYEKGCLSIFSNYRLLPKRTTQKYVEKQNRNMLKNIIHKGLGLQKHLKYLLLLMQYQLSLMQNMLSSLVQIRILHLSRLHKHHCNQVHKVTLYNMNMLPPRQLVLSSLQSQARLSIIKCHR